ncbi:MULTISPECIES: hypothetical protein [Bosea]|uniref:hypothetical protein n=1 Tax=Bosea TaxID=85413 RepID=UPI00214FF041|nr:MULTISPECIES: hypothetical protein [Bosea]MCR4523041.1 hypothetical protein [Bosea sp. 47.2.35]MDR6829931.1 hypothetical protein [Bosea robiniae]MDR6896813.1 hypothetical protein [Bosea sp. BE109]MDR7140165.1 hypothetical protein [Bosea sp. BE168]MDR7176862.1 hypothetical protein [Bosea sp. BE271]
MQQLIANPKPPRFASAIDSQLEIFAQAEYLAALRRREETFNDIGTPTRVVAIE